MDGFGFLGLFGAMEMDQLAERRMEPRQHRPGRRALEVLPLRGVQQEGRARRARLAVDNALRCPPQES